MSRIAFVTLVDGTCDYSNPSQTSNPHLKSLEIVRPTIGLANKQTWDQTWRSTFLNYITTEHVASIDMKTSKKAGKLKMLNKVNDFIERVRDVDASNVPQAYLETAIYVIFINLKAQVVVNIKKENTDQNVTPGRLPSLSENPSGSTTTPAPPQAIEPGFLPVSVRRVNGDGVIKSRLFWLSQFTVSPPPPHSWGRPEPSDLRFDTMQQLLSSNSMLKESESIYWMDASGNPYELSSDSDLENMGMYISVITMSTLNIQIRGSDTETVQFLWSPSQDQKVFVRDQARPYPWSSLKRPQGMIGFDEEQESPVSPKKARRSKPASLASSFASSLPHRPGRGRRRRRQVIELEDLDRDYQESEEQNSDKVGDEALGDDEDSGGEQQAEGEEPPATNPSPGTANVAAEPTFTDPSTEIANAAAEELLRGPAYDQGQYEQAVRQAIETEACAQMGVDDQNWVDACDFVKADSGRRLPFEEILIYGLAITMKKHQVLAAYWMILTQTNGCPGGFESDEMGYGKTIAMILHSYLNHCLVQARWDIKQFRAGKGDRTVPHLPASTPECPQSPHAQCPSRDKYPIECPCQEWSVSAKLSFKLGATLAILPVTLIRTWLTNYQKMFKDCESRFQLKCKIAWGAAKSSKRLRKYWLDEKDEHELLVDDDFRAKREHSAWLVLTSQNQKTFSKIQLKKTWEWEGPDPTADSDVSDSGWSRQCPGICFGSIYIDEAHRIKRRTNPVMTFLRQVNGWFQQSPCEGHGAVSVPPVRKPYVPAKWFVTGTPWERSPDDFAAALETIEQGSWSRVNNTYHSLRQENIARLSKIHEAYIKKALAGTADGDSQEAMNIIEEIRGIVRLFMIRRTDESTMFGYRVVTLPDLTVTWSHFTTPAKFAQKIADFRKGVSRGERSKYQTALAKWKSNNTRKPEELRDPLPAAPLEPNRKKAPSYRLRILADFPALINFLFDEDGEQIPSAFTTNDLQERGPLFKKHLHSILNESPKYQAILKLLQGTWPLEDADKESRMKPEDKLVTISNFPICAWLIKEGLVAAGYKTQLISGDMATEERDRWQDLFQEDPDIMEELLAAYPNDKPPQVLTATANLCSVGLTLHKAHHLVKLDVDFLDGGDRQALKRIYRIGQRYKCYVWRFLTTDNTEECMVRRRQELRAGIVSLAFKLPTNDYDISVEDEAAIVISDRDDEVAV